MTGSRWKDSLLAAGLGLIALAFYVPLRPHCLMGDDFTAFLIRDEARSAGLLRLAFRHDLVGWFRPASLIFIGLRARLHGPNAELYFYGNLLLAIATATAVALLAARESGSRTLGAVLGAYLLVHQSHYYLLIGLGGMDLVGNLVFLALLAALTRFLSSRRPAHHLAASALLALALLFRENYVAVGPVLAVACCLVEPKAKGRRWLLAALPLLISAGFLAARAIYLGPSSGQVPGARIGFSPHELLASFAIFLLDLPGVYFNEPWFTGIDASEVAPGIRIVQAAFVLVLVGLHAGWFASRRVPRERKWEAAVLGAVALALLLPPTAIHKHDPRYVAPSLMAWLLLLARMAATWDAPRLARAAALVGLAAYAAVTGLYFRRYEPNLYFAVATRLAEQVKALTVDRFGQELREMRVALPDQRELQYAILGGWLFRAYLHDPAWQPVTYSSLADLQPVPGRRTVVVRCPPEPCQDVTFALEERDEDVRRRADLLALFPRGDIEPEQAAPQSTPTGKGAFAGAVDDGTGDQRTVTVLSGFRYLTPPVRVESGDQLCLRYRLPLAASDGAALAVTAVSGGGRRVLLEEPSLLPTDPWHARCLSLAGLSGGTVRFGAEVTSPNGNAIADWVTFARFAVVQARPSEVGSGAARPR